MKIGIYGGSFNPIHFGHIGLAKWVIAHTDLDEVWLMVSPNNPLKDSSILEDEQVRLQKAKEAIAQLPSSTPYTLHPTPSNNPSPKKRPSLQGGAGGRPTSQKMRQQRNARVVLYLFALVFAFFACLLSNTHHGDIGAFCLLAAGICIYAIYKYLK